MQITIPDNAAGVLREAATQAGFASVDDYVLSIVLPSSKLPEKPVPKEPASERSFYDAALESGLIGSGSDYPSDLSTNPDHMKGFGE